jgi:hypothetical protein
LKGLSVEVAENCYDESLREAALNVALKTGKPAEEFIPSVSDRLKTRFYQTVRKYIPGDYMKYGFSMAK